MANRCSVKAGHVSQSHRIEHVGKFGRFLEIQALATHLHTGGILVASNPSMPTASEIAVCEIADNFQKTSSRLTKPRGVLQHCFVQMLECDRIYSVAGWVVAVGVSSHVFVAARPRPHPSFPSPLLEQLIGYLVGRGAEVVRTDIRFPLQWQEFGTLESTIRFWLRHYLEEGWKRKLFITLPPHVAYPIVLPLAAGAGAALNFWREVLVLMNALSRDNPCVMGTFHPNLWEVANMWEQHWAGTIKHTAKNSNVRPSDWAAVHDADRA